MYKWLVSRKLLLSNKIVKYLHKKITACISRLHIVYKNSFIFTWIVSVIVE